MYFKITNIDENHHGFQYQDGLNILTEKFNDNPNDSCCSGGFYFSDAANICRFIGYGVYLREISLPTDNKDFKMLKDREGDKWRSNMIIFGKRHDLSKVETFKFLLEKGADIHATFDFALRWGARNGHLDVVKFLLENGADIHANDNYALEWSANNGHFDMVKFLVEHGANIHSKNNYALMWSAENGHFDVVNFLVENGADIHAQDNYALGWSTRNGHTNVADFLISKGAKNLIK